MRVSRGHYHLYCQCGLPGIVFSTWAPTFLGSLLESPLKTTHIEVSCAGLWLCFLPLWPDPLSFLRNHKKEAFNMIFSSKCIICLEEVDFAMTLSFKDVISFSSLCCRHLYSLSMILVLEGPGPGMYFRISTLYEGFSPFFLNKNHLYCTNFFVVGFCCLWLESVSRNCGLVQSWHWASVFFFFFSVTFQN